MLKDFVESCITQFKGISFSSLGGVTKVELSTVEKDTKRGGRLGKE